jgi:hypothetical protein
VAPEFPPAGADPIAAAQQFARLPRADQEGAGQQNYLSVVLTMLVCQGRVLLLDQPETGLHPTQARQLGSWIAQNAARLGCQVFLATHSEALLGGLFEQNADVTILRLTRSGDSTTFTPIPPEIGNALVRSPVLAMQQAVDCLYCDGVIVVPQAEDCVVYETVARRFVGARGLRFLNAFGQRNLASLANLVRKAGIPVCVVADLESLQTEAGFAELVKAVTGDPPPPPWLATRERLAKHVEGLFDARELSAATHEVESFLDQMRKGGPGDTATPSPPPRAAARDKWLRLQREQLGSVPQELRVWVEELLDDLKHKGLFLSPKGGFQAWLPSDAPPGDREVAFAKAVQALHRGECPADLRAFVTEFVTFLRVLTQPRRPGRLRPGSDVGPT